MNTLRISALWLVSLGCLLAIPSALLAQGNPTTRSAAPSSRPAARVVAPTARKVNKALQKANSAAQEAQKAAHTARQAAQSAEKAAQQAQSAAKLVQTAADNVLKATQKLLQAQKNFQKAQALARKSQKAQASKAANSSAHKGKASVRKSPPRRRAPVGPPPKPATDLKVADRPSDNGDALVLTWKLSKDDGRQKPVKGYNVYAATSAKGPWFFAGKADAGNPNAGKKKAKQSKKKAYRKKFVFKGFKKPAPLKKKAKKGKKAKRKMVFVKASSDKKFFFKVAAFTKTGAQAFTPVSGPHNPVVQWFNRDKGFIFLLGLLICFFIIFFIQSAKRGRQLFIRKLAGLEAIDEAVGRATEMGRPVLFVPGIMDMDNVQTLAGLTILGHVSKTVAEYDTEIDVPVSKSLVMTTGREVVYQGYLEAGRPDAYSDDIVHYITDAQFGYVAGVNGTIVRDKPATCFYLGAFYAESLILAETGNSTGSIQIAGTAMPSQLPFFVAACDYTLIGEELFAASAYLSNDPKQMGSLKGQDVGKGIVMGAIVVGSLLATLATLTGSPVLKSALVWFKGLF
jgi:hypothetical protein